MRKPLAAPDVRRIVKDLLPPLVLRGVGALKTLGAGRFRFTGPYPTWEEATAHASGYDEAGILERVAAATRAVVRGEAAFERDSVLFREAEHPYPLLAVFLRAALESGGKLCVLDFGGSLGSVYHQCRPFLRGVTTLRWSVVEQSSYVECGQREFQTDELGFFRTIEESLEAGRPDVVLLSSVLQYLPDPQMVARKIATAAPGFVVVDRTPVRDGAEDTIVVQHVPASIYAASYPCRIFSRDTLGRMFGGDYRRVCYFDTLRFEALERALNARYEGWIFEHSGSHHPIAQP